MMWCRDDAKDTGNRHSSPSWSWGCVWALARAKLTPQKALGWSLGQNRPYRALRLQPVCTRGESLLSGRARASRVGERLSHLRWSGRASLGGAGRRQGRGGRLSPPPRPRRPPWRGPGELERGAARPRAARARLMAFQRSWPSTRLRRPALPRAPIHVLLRPSPH